MVRVIFALAAGWEVARFALLFLLVSSDLAITPPDFAATTLWFGSSQLAIAAAMLFAAFKPERLADVSLNITRIGKMLATLSGGVAFFSRMYQAIADETASGPVDWLRGEPIVLLTLAVDFTLVLFLLSYQPSDPTPSITESPTLPEYDVTEVEEEE